MGENWLTQTLTNRWTLALLAYLLGLLTCWVLWRLGLVRRLANGGFLGESQKGAQSANETAEQATVNTDAPPSEKNHVVGDGSKLTAIEAEIQRAKRLLEMDKRQHDALEERLSAVDDAVKRANGWLKLALRSIGNGKDDA